MRTLTPAAAILLFSASAFGKYYEAERYDVTLHLDSRGVLAVTETVVFRFIGGPFQYVFREIAATETDGIDNIRASMDGRPCAPGTGPGEVEMSGSSPVVVRWHFAPVLEGSHTFTVQYRAAGAVRPAPGSQALVWRALPQQRSYRVASSDIVLECPPGVEPLTVALGSGVPPFEIERGRASVRLINSPLGADVILNAQFPAGSFTAPPPAWLAAQERRDRDFRNGTRIGAAVSVILVALAFVWMFRIRAAARPGETGWEGGMTIASPPSSLPPALAGWLIGGAGLGFGTFLDLARRGVLRIEETGRGFMGSRHFQVVWCGASEGLAHHEVAYLQMVFRPGETTVGMRAFLSRQSRTGKFVAAIRAESQAAGLVDETRVRARRRLLTAGGIGLAAGVALFLIGFASRESLEFSFLAANAMVIGAAVLVAGLLALILGVIQPVWSDPGMVAAAQWKAFAHYLRQAARGRAELPDPAEFERFFPYAVVFGVAALLLKRQAKREGVALPAWFQAIQTADCSDSAAFLVFVDTCSSFGSGDGGTGGAGGGGGGGASGGGSSGAG
jgi:uncharacterized membrane protein YgcG